MLVNTTNRTATTSLAGGRTLSLIACICLMALIGESGCSLRDVETTSVTENGGRHGNDSGLDSGKFLDGGGGFPSNGGTTSSGGVSSGGVSSGGVSSGGVSSGGVSSGGVSSGGVSSGGVSSGGVSSGGVSSGGVSSGGVSSGGSGGTHCTPFNGYSAWLNPKITSEMQSTGNVSWLNPANASTSNNFFAVANLSASKLVTEYLWARSFGFQLPLNANVVGIEVAIERYRKAFSMSVWDKAVRLTKNGKLVGQDKDGTAWPSSEQTKIYGGGTDLWKTTWSASEVNSSTFGLVLAAHSVILGAGAATAYVDSIRIRVRYTVTC